MKVSESKAAQKFCHKTIGKSQEKLCVGSRCMAWVDAGTMPIQKKIRRADDENKHDMLVSIGIGGEVLQGYESWKIVSIDHADKSFTIQRDENVGRCGLVNDWD